jgi:signal transduction histidine kinase
MGITFGFLCSNVFMFLYWLMEGIKDIDILHTLLPLTLILFIVVTGVVLLNLHFQKNLLKQKIKQEELESKHQRDLLRASIHAEEEERKRIAQDLHDELGAVLSIMRMNLVMLERQQNTEAGDAMISGLQNARHLAETALTNVRDISHRLLPPQMQAFGLISTLESVIQKIEKGGDIFVRLHASVNLPQLNWETSLALYRILMELINNTIKHAGAKNIEISITSDGQNVICDYADDGKGLAHGWQHNGLGQKSMEGRVSALKGKLERSKEGSRGFGVQITVPLEQ